MTSQGSAYSRFQRALTTGNLQLIEAAAAELPKVSLEDALAILIVLAQRGDPRFERAAARWGAAAHGDAGDLSDARVALALVGAYRAVAMHSTDSPAAGEIIARRARDNST